MQPSTVSWSNLVKIKSGFSNYSNWPTINTPIHKNINTKICLVNTTVDQTPQQTAPKNINSGDLATTSIDVLVDRFTKVGVGETKKSREEIVAERKLRKLTAKQERQKKSLEQKLREVRAPKSQKLQMIDNTFMEFYHKCSNNSNSIKQPETQLEGNVHPPKSITKNRIKQRLKNKNSISISLVDLIENKKREKTIKTASKLERKNSIILSNPTIRRHRGKQREIQKAKPLKRLKRNILAIRKLRRKLREEAGFVDDSLTKSKLSSNSIKYSRKFRSYCDHYVTSEINTAVESLLQDLFRFQKRAYEKNKIKGSSKRRYIVGFNEVKRHMALKKVKLLIIAPDLEPNEGSGGLDDTVHNFKLISKTNEIPYIFAVSRWRIGRILFKKVPVSCVAVLNYDGIDDQYKIILGLLGVERNKFVKDTETINN